MIVVDTEVIKADLEIRNIIPLSDGRFDCELNHPKYGWIPFTAAPDDSEEHGVLIWNYLNSLTTDEE